MASIDPSANANYEITHLWACSLVPLSKVFSCANLAFIFLELLPLASCFTASQVDVKLYTVSLSLSLLFALMLIQKGTKGESALNDWLYLPRASFALGHACNTAPLSLLTCAKGTTLCWQCSRARTNKMLSARENWKDEAKAPNSSIRSILGHLSAPTHSSL